MPEPSLTKTSTIAPTPTKTPRPTSPPIPTITPFPAYKTKQVVFDYTVTGDHSIDGMFFEGSIRSYSMLVLYDDGQLIIPGEIYKQKILSPDEVEKFLLKLDALDFFSLESNHKHDPTDKLYNYGNNYQKSYDGRFYCIVVNADKKGNLCAYEPDLPFLIPKMKNILKYLDEFEPEGMTPYVPDRILLWVQTGRNPFDDSLPEIAILWDDNFPVLEESGPIIYVDGNMAREIYMRFESVNAGKVFIQNGKEYTVYLDVILPHERVTNPY